MKRILAILLLLLCFGCSQEDEKPKIEIYLLNKYVEPNEGIPFKETEGYVLLDSTYKEWYKDEWIDPETDQFIYFRSFDVAATDLQDYPFIKDEEIKGFNPNQDIFVFDTVVQQRIRYLFPGKQNVQFALTLDKKPLLTGYFGNSMLSRLPNTFYFYEPATIMYDYKETDTTEISYVLEFRRLKFDKSRQVKRPVYKPELIEAFRKSGRLRH